MEWSCPRDQYHRVFQYNIPFFGIYHWSHGAQGGNMGDPSPWTDVRTTNDLHSLVWERGLQVKHRAQCWSFKRKTISIHSQAPVSLTQKSIPTSCSTPFRESIMNNLWDNLSSTLMHKTWPEIGGTYDNIQNNRQTRCDKPTCVGDKVIFIHTFRAYRGEVCETAENWEDEEAWRKALASRLKVFDWIVSPLLISSCSNEEIRTNLGEMGRQLQR